MSEFLQSIYRNERLVLSPYACLSEKTAGRAEPITPCPYRTDFQRDRDRIIHSVEEGTDFDLAVTLHASVEQQRMAQVRSFLSEFAAGRLTVKDEGQTLRPEFGEIT